MSNRNTLLIACESDEVTLLEEYIAEHQESNDYNFLYDDGLSPLHKAIEGNSYKVVERLLNSHLVDVLQKTAEELDCLTLAVRDDNTSIDIVKMLIENDFQLADQCMSFPFVALMEKFNDKVRFVIEALKTRNHTLGNVEYVNAIGYFIINNCNQEKFRYFFFENSDFLTNNNEEKAKEMLRSSGSLLCLKLHISSYDEEEKWQEDLAEVFSMFFQKYPDDFGNYLMSSLIKMREYNQNVFINWCIKTYYLAESNVHHQLVQKVVKYSNTSPNIYLLMGLHSSVLKLESNVLEKLIKYLFECVSEWPSEVISEIGSVLGPKLDNYNFSSEFCKYFNTAVGGNEVVRNQNVSNVFKVVDHMKIGEKIQPNFFDDISEKCLVPLMAFSTVGSVYGLFRESILYEYMSVEIWARQGVDPVVEIPIDIITKAKEWQTLKQSETYAHFRSKGSLKSLCRSKIREQLVKSHGTKMIHSELVKYVKLLVSELDSRVPNELVQFLLFNLTSYNF